MYKNIFKRLIDILVSFFGLIVLSPLFVLLIIILHFANDGAGVFFTQLRPGKNEKIFKLIKFKSMNDKKDENGDYLKDKYRLTRAGKFIRKTSLDELPQLINVFLGQMSLIGPRPLAVIYLDYYNDIEKQRHIVRPGITGLAQVNGRKSLSWEERFKYDVEYVNSICFLLDMRIFFLTIKNVFIRANVNEESIGAIDFHKWRMQQNLNKDNGNRK
ncbi:MAG: sugar transferase [Bacteroidales bacterium]|nr:sugar transferase [Bacteroidales bacterium]